MGHKMANENEQQDEQARDQEQADREQFDEERKVPSIGGTDAAVITLEAAGVRPPFSRSRFDVWARLTRRKPEIPDTTRFELARLLEEPIGTLFTRRTGIQLWKPPQLVHPVFPWVTGHMDRAGVHNPSDVEIKTVEWDQGEWSDPEAGEPQRVPIAYLFQGIWYLGIPRLHRSLAIPRLAAFERRLYIAAQFGLSKPLRIYWWDADEPIRSIHARMFEACQEFWETYVLKDTPPPMSKLDPEAAKRWLGHVYPNAGKDLRVAGPDVADLARAYKEAQAKEAEGKREKEKLGVELSRLVGDAYGLTAEHDAMTARVTWPTIPARTDTDWEAVVRDLDVPVPADLLVKHQRVVKHAYRRLSVNVRGIALAPQEDEP